MVQLASRLGGRRRWVAALVGLAIVGGAGTAAALVSSAANDGHRGPVAQITHVAPATIGTTQPAPTTTTAGPTTTTAPTDGTAAAPSRPRGPASPPGHSEGAAIVGSAPSPPAPPSEEIIVCESPTVDQNGVITSSQRAYRAPAGTPPPPGCHLG